MTVKELYFSNTINSADDIKELKDDGEKLALVLTLCNDSKENYTPESETKFMGDPTETALVDFTRKVGMDKNETETKYNRVSELPFDSDRKLMTTVNNVKNGVNFIIK